MALIINLYTGHVSPQFHIVFDDNFETVASLYSGIEPKRWRWLSQHRREFNLNDSDAMIENTKVSTDTELERSTLFEVPKENHHGPVAASGSRSTATSSMETSPTSNVDDSSNIEASPLMSVETSASDDSLTSDAASVAEHSDSTATSVDNSASSGEATIITEDRHQPTAQRSLRPTCAPRHSPMNINTIK